MSEQQPVPPAPAPQEQPPPRQQDELTLEAPLLTDERTDRAVDDIMARESDALLAAEDAAAAQGGRVVPAKRRGFWGTIGHGFGLWLGTAKGRWLTFLLLVAAGATVAATPGARYWVLNTAGVRSSASIIVVDDITQLPLKGVPVRIAGQTKQTGADGAARFTGLLLGPARLDIARPGFAEVHRAVTVGWGSNPLGSVRLAVTGVRYAISVRDALSGAPLAGVQAAAPSVDATAVSDDHGKIELTLEDATAAGLSVTLSKDGYRSEQIVLKAANQTAQATLLTARKAVYVSKASGQYDLYKSDLDGANREVLLAGTGNENGNISLVISPDGAYAALVSTRENQHDADGFLLSTLTLVATGSGTAVTLARAGQIQLIDWIGSRLIFEQVSADPKIPPGARSSIVSYDYLTNSRMQLAAAPKLTSVFSAQSAVYYAVAAHEANGSLKPGFYKSNPDGSGRQTVYAKEVWGGLRTDYNTLALQTADGWVAYDFSKNTAAPIDAPASFTSRLYRDNPDRSRSLWVNQGVLLAYGVAAATDTPVQTQAGLGYPVQWLGSDTVIYRVVTASETADYAASLTPGVPARKIADVANTYGFSAGQ